LAQYLEDTPEERAAAEAKMPWRQCGKRLPNNPLPAHWNQALKDLVESQGFQCVSP
jgi:hypothetical protein